MIAYISILILILSVIYFFYSLGKRGIKNADLNSIIRKGMKDSFNEQSIQKHKRGYIKLKLIVIHINMALFILMFLSSFIPTAFTGEHLSGLFLIIHVTLAPLFSLSLAALILFYSYELKLNGVDFVNTKEWIKNITRINSKSSFSYIKILFWLLTIISIPLILSIILSLYPITGTELQNFYLLVHRLGALFFSLVVLGLIYFLVILLKTKS